MNNILSNARHADESFPEYQKRRREMNKAIKRYSRGVMSFISARIVQVGVPPSDQDKKLIERGLIRDLTPPRVGADGKLIRLGRTKGETFQHPAGREKFRADALAARRAR